MTKTMQADLDANRQISDALSKGYALHFDDMEVTIMHSARQVSIAPKKDHPLIKEARQNGIREGLELTLLTAKKLGEETEWSVDCNDVIGVIEEALATLSEEDKDG